MIKDENTLPTDKNGRITLQGDDLVKALHAQCDIVLYLENHADIGSHAWHANSVTSRQEAGVTKHFPEYSPSQSEQLKKAYQDLANAKTEEEKRAIKENAFRPTGIEISEDKSKASINILQEYANMKEHGIQFFSPDTEIKNNTQAYIDRRLDDEVKPIILHLSNIKQTLMFDNPDNRKELEKNLQNLELKIKEKSDDIIETAYDREGINLDTVEYIARHFDPQTGEKASAKWGLDHGVNFEKHNPVKDFDEYLQEKGFVTKTVVVFGDAEQFKAFVKDIKAGKIYDPPDVLVLADEGYGNERAYVTEEFIRLNDIKIDLDIEDSKFMKSLTTEFEKANSAFEQLLKQDFNNNINKGDYFEFGSKLISTINDAYKNDGYFSKKEYAENILPAYEKFKTDNIDSSILMKYNEKKASLTIEGDENKVTFDSKYKLDDPGFK